MAINDGAIYSALNDQNLLSACKLKWNIKSINRALLSPLTIPGKKLEIVLKTGTYCLDRDAVARAMGVLPKWLLLGS